MNKEVQEMLFNIVQRIVDELGAIRAELASLRRHSGAQLSPLSDRECYANRPPPNGAKRGRWVTVSGAPHWIESHVTGYDAYGAPIEQPVTSAQ